MLSLQVVAAGVCGSDRDRLASGQHIDSLGHELVAWEPRQERFVAIRPLAPCGRCGPCTRGATEHCADDAGLGRRPDRVAGFGGRVTVRPDQVYPLPDTLPVPTALLADPLACLWHALHGIPLAGVQVLVIGDGALAALACLMARERGAEHVEVAVKCEERRSRMQPFADVVVTTGQSSPRGYDLVLEAAGGPGTDLGLSVSR